MTILEGQGTLAAGTRSTTTEIEQQEFRAEVTLICPAPTPFVTIELTAEELNRREALVGHHDLSCLPL